MKTVSKAQKPAAKAGKTANQITAGEYRKELHYLRRIMEKTNLAPAEISDYLKRMDEMRASDIRGAARTHQEIADGATLETDHEGTEFQKWIDSIPELPDGPDDLVPMKVELNLNPRDWIIFAKLAKRKMESIGFIMEDILADYACEVDNCGKFITLKH